MEYSSLFLLSENMVASNAISAFDLQFPKRIKGRDYQSYSDYNAQIFSLLSWLPLEDLYISITSSESIFYRFKLKDIDFDFMWEAFLDYDGEGNKGSTLQIYKGDNKYKSITGDVDAIYGIINEVAFPVTQNYVSFTIPMPTSEYVAA